MIASLSRRSRLAVNQRRLLVGKAIRSGGHLAIELFGRLVDCGISKCELASTDCGFETVEKLLPQLLDPCTAFEVDRDRP